MGYLCGLVTRFDNLLPEYLSINKFISRLCLLKREVVAVFSFLLKEQDRSPVVFFILVVFFPCLFVGGFLSL